MPPDEEHAPICRNAQDVASIELRSSSRNVEVLLQAWEGEEPSYARTLRAAPCPEEGVFSATVGIEVTHSSHCQRERLS